MHTFCPFVFHAAAIPPDFVALLVDHHAALLNHPAPKLQLRKSLPVPREDGFTVGADGGRSTRRADVKVGAPGTCGGEIG